MSGITSDIGLISGINIADTVNKLIAISARPRDALTARNKSITAEQAALAQLTASVLAVQSTVKQLARTETFSSTKAISSGNGLDVSVTGTPAPGAYTYTPVQRAQAQQILSSGLGSADDKVGAGAITLGYGGLVDAGAELSALNGGAGVARGKIKITDRSGASAIVDLRFAKTIDDVLSAINSTDGLGVTAEAQGDSLVLNDTTGANVANLRVQEVGGGRTAADLGLSSINDAVTSKSGSDIRKLYAGLDLAQLNDGAGVGFRAGLADLSVSLRDGTTVSVDFQTTNRHERTLGDLLKTINEASPAKLKAEISASGDHIVLTDLSSDTGGTFAVTSPAGSTVAADLGLTGSATGDTLTSSRLQGGLKSVLLDSLGGGQGLGTLGDLDLTDRSGATATVDLSSASTLDDVIQAINAAGIGIQASVDRSRGGLTLTDTTGGAGHLIVANGDADNSATKLKIAVNAATSSVESGSLGLQTVSTGTRLSSLNGGNGVQRGSFVIYNSAGVASAINLSSTGVQTVGDVIDLINAQAHNVTARINDSGDGILLTDTAGGAQSFHVSEVGTGTVAADLHLNKTASGGAIDGATRTTLTLAGTEKLSELVTKINNLKFGVTAGLLDDGSGSAASLHLALTANKTGAVGNVQIYSTVGDFTLSEHVRGQDALLLAGTPDSATAFATSSTNDFSSLVSGATISLNSASHEAETITVSASSDAAVTALKQFVTQYNNLRKKLDDLTSFDATANTTGILFGSNEALRIEAAVSDAVTKTYYGAGSIRTLAELGLSISDKGQLSLDETKARKKLSDNPAAAQEFFTKATVGAAVKFNAALENIAGVNHSLLLNRNAALQAQADANSAKIEDLNTRLDTERNRLTDQFNALEQTLSKYKALINSISQIQPITIASSSSNSSNG